MINGKTNENIKKNQAKIDQGKMRELHNKHINGTNIRVSPKNFLNSNFNSFPRLVQNFEVIPCSSPKLSNLKKEDRSKKLFFLIKPL